MNLNLKPVIYTSAGIGLAASIAGLITLPANEKANKEGNANSAILNDTTITAQQYDNFSKRVESGKATWTGLSDSINDAREAKADSIKKVYNAKVDSVKNDVLINHPMPAKKFKALEKKAGRNLSAWEKISKSLDIPSYKYNNAINEGMKAEQMRRLRDSISKIMKP